MPSLHAVDQNKALNRKSLASSRQQLEIQALFETIKDISSHLDLDKVLQAIVERSRDLVGSDCAHLSITVEGANEVLVRAAVGYFELDQIRIKSGEGLMGLVKQGRIPVFVTDYLMDPRLAQNPVESARREGVRACLGVPLILGDDVIGVLTVANRRAKPFTPDDGVLLSTLANSAAIAIENARLFERKQEQVLQLTELNARVNAQHALLKRAVAMHDQLTEMVLEDRGIRIIAETLAHLLDNPVGVSDRFHKLIVYSSGIGPAGNNQPEDTSQYGLPHDALDHPWVKEKLQQMAEGHRPIYLSARPDIGIDQPKVIAPILAAREVLGYLSVVEENRKLEELDFVAIEHSATIFALEMMKQKIAVEVEQQLKGDFLDDLLNGTFRSPKSVVDRAAHLGYDLSGPQQLLIVDVDDFSKVVNKYSGDEKMLLSFKKRLLNVISQALQRNRIRCLMAGKSDSIVIVLPAEGQGDGKRSEVDRIAEWIRTGIARELPEVTVLTVVGSVCPSVIDFTKSYEESRKALDIAKGLGMKNRTVTLDELGAYWILFQVRDKSELQLFVRRTLGPLLDYDAQHTTQLVPTLAAFLQNNCCIQSTAQTLFVHTNTLTYRLKRIQEICKIDLANPEHRLSAQLASKIIGSTLPS